MPDPCYLCEAPVGDDDPQSRPWTVDLLEGRCAHVKCLEKAGLWNSTPRGDDE